ncbi:TPA: NADH:flavin oxidoreductase [Methanosarcina acetivorans]|uniref:NADH peroxidase n=2 Tax=Methanosarcina acetivorans TaxID=2214 RepID=Q8TQW1_METAC|nr:NADH:flavin oxidoreductase [Methanosarcina acetivorans]AAM04841.1 NADH peroxidase [Methanosarcina acetivorans C2A]HIH95323.1 NADH:flavin oxidoreductase [Methanosarcina acetivorans]
MIFDPITVCNLELQNRFVRSATHEFMAEKDGTPTSRLGDLYEELAINEVGLIITGYSYVLPGGQSDNLQQAIYDDRFIEPYQKITERVHRYRSKIVIQIVHGGRQADISDEYPVPIAPSVVKNGHSSVVPREMTEQEILDMIEAFTRAAGRAKVAGFDGIQLHCAHGFLLSNFISPYTNRRTDRWGGSVENRARIVTEIIRRIKEDAGDDFPILVKMNATDGFLPGSSKAGLGLDAPECVEIAKILERAGVCAIEVSGGIGEAGGVTIKTAINSPAKEAYFKNYSKMIKAAVNVPVILVGGIRSLSVMECLLENGCADLISMSRVFISEPDFIPKLRSGAVKKARCVSCNLCFDSEGIRCNFEFD